jgi:hypothetical protein
MKRLLIVGGTVGGAALLARRFASSCGGADFARIVERMPENAPPKWMFRNITAIRENTERILQLLEGRNASTTTEPSQDPR